MKHSRILIVTAAIALASCQHRPVEIPSAPNPAYGGWLADPGSKAPSVVLVPQWHLSPQTNTKDSKESLPQAPNQLAIYHQLSNWVSEKSLNHIVVEGCEGEINDQFTERYNGWTLKELMALPNEQLESTLTHVGLKLKAKHGESLHVVCGDNLDLIKKHQLVLSDLRGLFGFKVRIGQFKNDRSKRVEYTKAVRDLLKLSSKASEEEVISALDHQLRQKIDQFEKLIGDRNRIFIETLKKLSGRSAIVIGAIHETDLKNQLMQSGQNFAVFKPVGFKGDEAELIEQIKNLVHHRGPNSFLPTESAEETLNRIWKIAKNNIYPKSKEVEFTEAKFHELKSKLSKNAPHEELAEILNPFLSSLGVSHTRLYVEGDPDYYFFRSLFSSRVPHEPKVRHIGAQFLKEADGYKVRATLQGYPARQSGLRRGDVIRKVDGKPFHPISSFLSEDRIYTLEIVRNGRNISTKIRPIFEAIPESFLKATENSAKIIRSHGKKLGYVQLWTGAFGSEKILANIVKNDFKSVDGLILDLRDGFGAAWWDHLDAFFLDRGDYFVPKTEKRDGSVEVSRPPQQTNPDAFSKPIVILINEGVRSGKEALTYQFKKSRRAKLIGTTTAGAFVSGRGFFSDEERGYILYLAVNGITLDGTQIEGFGITPDLTIEYPYISLSEDPQLAAAIRELTGNKG